MMDVKPILNAAVALQAASLAGESLKLARKKKKKPKDFLSAGTGLIVGSALIKSESDFLNS